MLTPIPSIRVTMYLKEDRVPAVLDFLFTHRVAGATVVRAYAGFGSHHHLHTANLVDISVDLPVILQFVDTRDKLETWFPQIAEVVKGGLLSTQEILVYKPSAAETKPDAGSLLR
jgi:uncharacterized protein